MWGPLGEWPLPGPPGLSPSSPLSHSARPGASNIYRGRVALPSSTGAAHRTLEADQFCPTCPYFLPTSVEVTTPVGIPANLTCGVRQLGDKKVSWIRRKDLHVLTTGNFTYTTDTRFRALHLPGSPFWSLEVDRPAITDSGLYECQVST
ncbi:uncharacterized protein LOC126993637, partial [Eriocheir sinensis]|uniref:uncharacterized protein LOC126993637 n=1 Tax=Eriocheir sinensis TaxID=95602 RepID=UPI0021C82574